MGNNITKENNTDNNSNNNNLDNQKPIEVIKTIDIQPITLGFSEAKKGINPLITIKPIDDLFDLNLPPIDLIFDSSDEEEVSDTPRVSPILNNQVIYNDNLLNNINNKLDLLNNNINELKIMLKDNNINNNEIIDNKNIKINNEEIQIDNIPNENNNHLIINKLINNNSKILNENEKQVLNQALNNNDVKCDEVIKDIYNKDNEDNENIKNNKDNNENNIITIESNNDNNINQETSFINVNKDQSDNTLGESEARKSEALYTVLNTASIEQINEDVDKILKGGCVIRKHNKNNNNLKLYGGYNGNLQCGTYIKQNINQKN